MRVYVRERERERREGGGGRIRKENIASSQRHSQQEGKKEITESNYSRIFIIVSIITVFLLKIRHENNNIALALPNFYSTFCLRAHSIPVYSIYA